MAGPGDQLFGALCLLFGGAGWFMAVPFRSGGAGPVAAGDPRLAAGLAAASPAAVGGAGLPPGSEGSRNRTGNGCSPAMNGTLTPAVRCAR